MADKIGHAIKMTWMAFWRMALFLPLFGVSSKAIIYLTFCAAVFSSLLAIKFNRAVKIFPLARLISLRSPFMKIESNTPVRKVADNTTVRGPVNNRSSNVSTVKREPQFFNPVINSNGYYYGELNFPEGVLSAATSNGRKTNFEPSTFAEFDPKKISTENHTGEPGQSLKSADELNKEQVDLGIKGERNFYNALERCGLTNKFKYAWSVPMPDYEIEDLYTGLVQHKTLKTDIDCIIFTDDTMFLVDLKQYKSGNVTYFSTADETLYCVDNVTGQLVGEPKSMSGNMKVARTIMSKHFPHIKVQPVVVLMPTDKGEGTIGLATWNGNIPIMNLSDFLGVLFSKKATLKDSDTDKAFNRIRNYRNSVEFKNIDDDLFNYLNFS